MALGKKKMTKAQKIILLVILGIAVITIFAITAVSEDKSGTTVMRQGIAVENGRCNVYPIQNALEIKENGTYQIESKWWPEEDIGFVTGLYILGPSGEEIFAETADKMDSQSEKMKLEAGTYTIHLEYLTSVAEEEAFWKEHNLTSDNGSAFQFAENGEWIVEYSISFNRIGISAITWGVIFGFIVGIILVYILRLVINTGESSKSEYDERQILVRATGFKYGFVALALFNILIGMLYVIEMDIPVEIGILLISGVILSIMVSVTYCIFREGYFAMNEDRKRVVIAFSVILVFNTISIIINAKSGTIVNNGKLAVGSLNIVGAIAMVYVLIIIAIKAFVDKKED